jgi:4-nitrophenyl phosphatase
MLAGGEMVPGGGAIVAAVATAAGREPVTVGKPSAELAEIILSRQGLASTPERVLMVGDRLDTDVRFGRSQGMRTLLVRTGATDDAALAACEDGCRPEFVADSVAALLR